jgi:antitoxin VapB
MSLNIKNERVHALARRASQITGRSQTSVIEIALEELLTRLQERERSASADVLLAGLQRDIQTRGRLSTEDLYDESGLPT